MEQTEQLDIDKISSIVNSQSTEIIKLLEKCEVKCGIPPLNAFEERYSIKFNFPTKETSSEHSQPATPTELTEAFKALDKIPPCFAKIQRKPSLQSSGKQNSSKRNESFSSSVTSNTSLAKVNVDDILVATSRLFKECKERDSKFENVLKTATMDSRSTLHQFKESTQSLRRALEDLEKLVPRGLEGSVEIFDSAEEKAISDFREEIDALFCIQENKDLYPIVEMPDDKDLDVISKLAGDLLRVWLPNFCTARSDIVFFVVIY